MKALLFNIQKFSLHDGPGIRTTLFFKGCNLRCKWCANPESMSAQPEPMNGSSAGRYYTLDEVMTEIMKDKPFYDKSGGGVTLSGGEPLLQPEFVCALSDRLHDAGITVGIESAANVPAEVFKKVLDKCDFAKIDCKHWDSNKYLSGTGADHKQTLRNLRYALGKGLSVIVCIPVIPGFNNAAADAHAYSALLAEYGAKEVHILPFHQLGENKYTQLGKTYPYAGVPQLHDEDVREFADIIASAGLQVQIGG